jgi:hypothetical protein
LPKYVSITWFFLKWWNLPIKAQCKELRVLEYVSVNELCTLQKKNVHIS